MLGRVDDAVGAYRSAFDAEREFQQVHCLAYLEFAELVLAVGRTDLFAEAFGTLKEFCSGDAFPIEHCRALIAQALLQNALGEHEPARRNARRALVTIARTQSMLGEREAVLATGGRPRNASTTVAGQHPQTLLADESLQGRQGTP